MKRSDLALNPEYDPGIRAVVAWLQENDFPTCDSGDGVTKLDSMECAWELPHVAMSYDNWDVWVSDGTMLADLIERLFSGRPAVERNLVSIEATWYPVTGEKIILLTGLSDDMMPEELPEC